MYTEFPILTILSVQPNSTKYIHNAVRHHHPFPGLFIISHPNSVPTKKVTPQSPLLPAPG